MKLSTPSLPSLILLGLLSGALSAEVSPTNVVVPGAAATGASAASAAATTADADGAATTAAVGYLAPVMGLAAAALVL